MAIEQLDHNTLLRLSHRTDPLGVLSVYVNVDPGDGRDAAAIDIGNRLRELRNRVASTAHGPDRHLAAALDRVLPQVEQLTDPREPGRSRIGFVGLSDDRGEFVRLNSAMPVPNRVVLNQGPFIHPLLELLDEGRPAGVVLASGKRARVLQWRLGRLQPLDSWEQQVVEASHERAGQIGGGPSGQFHTPMLEHRQGRARDRDERFVNWVGQRVVELSSQWGWERLLLSGGPRWTPILAGRLPRSLRQIVIQDTRVLAGLSHEKLVHAVNTRLRECHRQQEHRLARQLSKAGLDGAAALGLSEVTSALNEGRVAHLVYDPHVRYAGSVATNGLLQAGAEYGPGGPAVPEPRLSERLVERALATGARISPVEGAAQGALSRAAGIGALLRW